MLSEDEWLVDAQYVIGDGVSVEERADGMVLIKDGVVAGLSRSNVENYDAKLGFLLLTSSLVYQLDSDQKLLAEVFDRDWNLMIKLGKKLGLDFNRDELESVQACSGLAAKTGEDVDSPDSSEANAVSSDQTCANCD